MFRDILRSTKRAVTQPPHPRSTDVFLDRFEEQVSHPSHCADDQASTDRQSDPLAGFQAAVLNAFVADNIVSTVIEFGLGDGTQLELADYPNYVGVDVNPKAVAACRKKYPRSRKRQFFTLEDYDGQPAGLSLSLDVIPKLVDDDVFDRYMAVLFDASEEFVAIYATNHASDADIEDQIKHRVFTDWIAKNRPEWVLFKKIETASMPEKPSQSSTPADFYFFFRPFDGS